MVNLMMGGYDSDQNESHLYYLDYLAAQVPVDYYAFGYGGMFMLSVMDKEYRNGKYVCVFAIFEKQVIKLCNLFLIFSQIKKNYSIFLDIGTNIFWIT